MLDGFARFMKILALGGSAVSIIFVSRYLQTERQQRFEYAVLILLSTLGMMVLSSAADLIALYLGLEIMSLALYVLAAIRRDSVRSTEAGLKYFVLGALSSGMLLYGASLIYGFTGTVSFSGIAKASSAGGVGLILCQWANYLGANVIGTVGSKDKAALAKANGCHHTILYREEDFVARVKEITGGKMCEVVYDGIGKTTLPASLDCLKPLGMFVSFGSASGQIDAFNINILQTKGSLYATRPTLNTYAAKRQDLLAIANGLFDVVGKGAVKVPVNQKYPLRDAVKAHRDLEGRATTGSSILVP